jgi:hypothetical protein
MRLVVLKYRSSRTFWMGLWLLEAKACGSVWLGRDLPKLFTLLAAAAAAAHTTDDVMNPSAEKSVVVACTCTAAVL